MARDFFINGSTMCSVKGNTDIAISSLTQLGLPATPTRVTLDFKHKDINVDGWGGGEMPADVQFMIAGATVAMNLIHVDAAVLERCVIESMAGGFGGAQGVFGELPVTGTRMGGGNARFATGNHYIGLNLASPIGARPWRFLFAYLTGPPLEIELGAEKSMWNLNWRVVPYTVDPFGSASDPGPGSVGQGTKGYRLWDRVLDT